MDNFTRSFQTKVIPVQTDVKFSWKEDVLAITVGSEKIAEIKDLALCQAFFGMYLSIPPRVPEIRSKIVADLSRFV